MRNTTELFTINGKPMLVPDEDVAIAYEDLDASDSGRDESGYLHRIVVRYKVANWSFSYSHLTEEERKYMEGLFPETGTFAFGHPTTEDATMQTVSTCYRSKYELAWKNAITGLWSNYNFRIIEC